ncbi:hypothetical protein [Kribbella italica]|uniref:Uncharacterized protein n=1 Tax=Kribbella italica TaxID=1540520 RepID=A0A7W9MXA7_9ACTN|nr:hypothetical protein [Kribbella italica]MBB5839564.1 hypothetical protein [Kribbella italica]
MKVKRWLLAAVALLMLAARGARRAGLGERAVLVRPVGRARGDGSAGVPVADAGEDAATGVAGVVETGS